MPAVQQELLTLPKHLSSTPVFSGIRITQSLLFCVCFVDCCLSFCLFSFGHCVVCSSSNMNSDYPFGMFKTLLNILEALFFMNIAEIPHT